MVEPRGGFYIWLKLPPKLDIMSVLKASIEKGAVFVIGKTFDPQGKIIVISDWRTRTHLKTKSKKAFKFLVNVLRKN